MNGRFIVARFPLAVSTVSLLCTLAIGCHRAPVHRGAPEHHHDATSDSSGTDSGRVLPPSVQPGFQHVLDLANRQHRLGAGISIHGIAIGSTSARIDLDLGDRVVSVRLEDPNVAHAHRARYFGLHPAAVVPPEVLDALAAALDAAFPRDPFVGVGTDDQLTESGGSNLARNEDPVVGNLPHDRGMASRSVAWLALAVLLSAMIATGAALHRERPA